MATDTDNGAGAWSEVPDLLDLAAEPGAVPVIDRDPRERIDWTADRDGGHFRMGAQVGWSPAREGQAAGPAPEAQRAAIRASRSGDVRAQDPRTCDVCGGYVVAASDRVARTPALYRWRAEVEPGWPTIGPEDTCAGCLRQGAALAQRVAQAAIALTVAEARRAATNAWAWVDQPPDEPGPAAASASEPEPSAATASAAGRS